jgi:hypothetical protein
MRPHNAYPNPDADVVPGPKEGDTPARVLFALCQQAAICATSDELIRLITGGQCKTHERSLYRSYLLPFGDPNRKTLPIEVAWWWCRTVSRTSSILRLTILLEPGCVRLGVFRVDDGKRWTIRMCDPLWVVGEGLLAQPGADAPAVRE